MKDDKSFVMLTDGVMSVTVWLVSLKIQMATLSKSNHDVKILRAGSYAWRQTADSF